MVQKDGMVPWKDWKVGTFKTIVSQVNAICMGGKVSQNI